LASGVEVRRFCYDERFNLVQESIGSPDPATHLITHHRYNESDKRIRTIRPRGNEVQWGYDERLLPVSVTRGASSPDASTTHTGYSADGLKIRSVDGRGNIAHYAYDAFNRLVQTTDPLGNVSRLDYDKSGNVVVERFFEVQSDGTYLLLARSEYEFDELNRRVVEKTNLFQVGQPATDPETDFLASPGLGDVLLTQTFYDKKGRVVTVVNAKGQETIREYDVLDRKTIERDALGNFTRLSYDSNSNLVRSDTHERVIDPSTGALREEVFSTLYEYDEMDRRISTTDGLGNTTRFAYDSRNSLIRQIDPLGNTRGVEYDVYGRKVTETSERTVTGLGGGIPLPPAITRSEYDDNGNLVASIDAKGNRTEQEFDALDRRTTVRYPDATTQRFQYDPDDHVVVDEDNNGLRRLYTFDALDRMIRMDLDRSGLAPNITVEGATFAQFEYDALRRVVLERNDFAEMRAQVDSLGRRYEETMSFTTPAVPPLGPLTVRREFDALSNLTQLMYPGGRVVRYHLDALNRIERIENASKGQDYPGSTTFPDTYEILHHQYRGLRKGRTLFGNGASTTYDYDGNARIIQIAHAIPGESLILQHLYDAAGNMRFKNDVSPAGNLGEAYKYDSFYWLTKFAEATDLPVFDPSDFVPADAPKPRDQLNGQARIDAMIGPLAQDPADFTFRYDLTGDREEEREQGQSPILYASNILNQYSVVGAQTFSYDRNGNLIEDGRRQYVYDYQNRLAHVHEPSTGQDTKFFYDARGRRILNQVAGQATHLVADGQNVIEEYRPDPLAARYVLVAQYVNEYGLDTTCQMARRDDAASPGNEYWYHKDLVRSSRILTDSTGIVKALYRYSPFGALVPPEPLLNNPYMFMGRCFDTTLEACDFRAREYAPTIGRFLQRDPVPSKKLYLFVENNPLVAIDPRGWERESPSDVSLTLHRYMIAVRIYKSISCKTIVEKACM
jgi:RHS repeat-associated protein